MPDKKIPDKSIWIVLCLRLKAEIRMDGGWHMDLYPAGHVVADPGGRGGPWAARATMREHAEATDK